MRMMIECCNKWWIKWVITPLFTALGLYGIWWAIEHHIPFFGRTAAFGYWIVLAAGLLGGWRSGFISACMAVVFTYFVIPIDEGVRFWNLALSAFVWGILPGLTRDYWLKANINEEKAEFVDSLNGSLEKLANILDEFDAFIVKIRFLDREALEKDAINIRIKYADLVTAGRGWWELAKAKKFVEGELGE